MSSPRLNLKRRSDYETSESEDDCPALRRARKCRREDSMFSSYLLYFKESFSAKCKDLWQWVTNTPFSKKFQENMYKNSIAYTKSDDLADADIDVTDVLAAITVEDEDEDSDVAVVYENNDPSPSTLNASRRGDCLRSPFNGLGPLSSSTPFIRVSRPVMDISYNNSSRQRVNGFRSNNWGTMKDEVGVKKKRPIAPITNPGVDVQILLDEDLEIIEEIPKGVTSPLFPKSRATYKLNGGPSKSSQVVIVNESSDSECTVLNGHSSPYTAHEVVRLQEKAQYKLLLDKLVNESIYRPVVRNSRSQSAAIQVDLTEDDHFMGSRITKEVSKETMTEFLKKYFKPSHKIVPPRETNPSLQLAPEAKDDDVKVIEVKTLPKFRRRHMPRSDFFSPDWIEELKMTISSETEKRLQIVAEQEQKIERYRSRRDAKIAEENRLREELMKVMLPHVKVEKEDEFPDLTADMNSIIDAAFESPHSGQVLSSINRVDITSSDIATLSGLSWLNDTIINCYLQLIVERSKLDNFPSVYSFNSFFYVSLKTRGENNVLRWTRKVDIFSYDIVFVPLHLGKGMHWALGVIDNRTKKIKYYDSMRGSDVECLTLLRRYIVVEMKDKKKITIDENYYSIEAVKDIPQQMNGSDCGMFTLKYAEYISRDAPITFTQQNMQYFRRKMVYELLTKQLL